MDTIRNNDISVANATNRRIKEQEMIEKITPDHILGLDGLPTTIMPDSAKLMRKINELVDAVNILQCKNVHIESDLQDLMYPKEIKDELGENVQDKFAEQRKWIGKLCRFWNFEDGEVDIGILKAIDNLKPAIPYINDIDCSYAYCEPVKQDDDIIYKGENNNQFTNRLA